MLNSNIPLDIVQESIKTTTKGTEHDKRTRISRKRFPSEKINGIRKSGYYPKANKRSVWTINTKPFKGAHFAVFPPNLIKPCLTAGCPEWGVVLDPFFGSGTTGIVAYNYNRMFIGIELNHEYCQLASKRIQEETKQMRFNFTKSHFKSTNNDSAQSSTKCGRGVGRVA
jgi:DNA modification methylase